MTNLIMLPRLKIFLLLMGILVTSFFSGLLIVIAPEFSFLFLGIVGLLIYIWLCISYSFTAFVLFIFIASTEIFSRVSIISGISISIVVGFIFALIWAFRTIFRGDNLARNNDTVLLITLFGWVVISVIYNLDRFVSLRPIFTYILQFILVFLTVNLSNTINKLWALGNIIIAASVFLAFIMLLGQYNLLFGLSLLRVTTSVETTEVVRLSGTLNDPNFTAAQLTIAYPFIFNAWYVAKQHWIRVVYLITSILIFLAFSLTVSNGGLIGLIAIIVIQFIVLSNNQWWSKVIQFVILMVFGFVVFTVFLPSNYQARFVANVEDIQNFVETPDINRFASIGTQRGDTWTAAFNSLKNSPLVGYGPGNGIYFIAPLLTLQTKETAWAHNTFLSYANDVGVIALGIVLILFIRVLLIIWVDKNQKIPEMRYMAKSLFVGILTIVFVQGFFIDIFVLKLPWILLGLGMSYKQIRQQQTLSASK